MASIAKLVVSLGANISDFETDMKRASKLSDRELKKMERQAKRLNDEWNRRFKYAGAAVASGLAVATKAAIDFEKAMAEVATLGAGNIDELGESVKDLAVQFGQAPTEQARALYQIISAGASDSATQLEQLTAANKLAVGGITDVATAADGLTTVLNAYEGSGLTAQNVSDILFATMKGGKTTVDELASSVGQVATIAAQTGVGFDELGATVATLTKSGLATSEAMTSLRSVLSAVLKQSKQTKDAAQEIGISFDVAALKSKGLFGVLQDIANSGATEDQLAKLVGRVEGLTAVLSATREGGRVFNELLVQIANSAGITEEALAEMTDTAGYQLDRLKSAISVLGIDLGSKFLPAIAGFAESIVNNMDKVMVAVQTVAAFVITRVGVGMVYAFANAAAGARTLATAMAFVGGPVGLVASAVAILVVNWDDLLARQDGLGNFVRQLDRGFTILWGVIKAVAYELGNLVQIALDVFDLVAAPISAIITSLGLAAQALSEGRLIDAGKALGDVVEASGKRASAAFDRLKGNIADIGKGAEYMADAWEESAGRAGDAAEGLDDVLSEVVVTAQRMPDVIKKSDRALDTFADRTKDARDRLKEVNKLLGEAFSILDITVERNPFKELGEAIGGFVDEVINGVDPLADMKRAAEDLVDSLNPGQAAAERFANELTLLRDYADATGKSVQWLAEQELLLAQRLAETNQQIYGQAEGLDYLSEIMLEAARQLERTFSDIFTGIIDGALDAWGAIERGFQTLVTNIAQNPIRVIVADIQKAFGPGGGGLADLDLKKLGGDLITAVGNIIGLSNANDIFGQVFSTAGSIGGKILGAKFLSIFGSFAGPIGSAIGSILGSLVGNWVSDLFARDLAFSLGGSNQRTRGDNQQIRTPLGDILGLSGQGGFGSLLDPNSFGGQLAKVLTEFDTQIANIFKEVGLDDATFQAVTDSLENWVASFGENASAVDVVASRFNVILGNFNADVQDFVRGAADFESQIERFGVALSADKLVRENADVLGGATTGQLLDVIEGFQQAGESIGEAFQRFIPVLESVISVTATLRDFASSDPLADLDALINPQSLEQSLANVNGAILDLITNFDGSIEQLQAIGELSLVARQGELQLLQQIDSIQKGLTERLQSLRDFVTGADQAPKSIAKVLAEAEGLILQARNAQSSSDIARIGGEFDALIRSLSEDQLGIAQKDILNLITLFEQASSGRLSTIRDNTLDNAATVRDAVDTFVTEIGDPLDIIAASLEGANLSESLNEGFESVNQNQTENTDRLIAAILESGEVTVNVVVQDTGLVTQ